MNIAEAVKYASPILSESLSPQLDVEVILGYCLNKDRVYLFTHPDMELSNCQEGLFKQLIERRCHGEPVQYITGTQEFMSLDFKVAPGVLIPRSDTEVLVENVLNELKDVDNPMAADVGCGSGAISVSLASYNSKLVVYALDIMDVPLELTRDNALSNNVSDRVKVLKSDLLSGLSISLRERLDAIVSNPPYIKDAVIPQLMREVREYEPIEALSGGADGLAFYRSIIKKAPFFLKPNGLIAFEIGYDQAGDVEQLLLQEGFVNVQCVKDLAGLDRVIMGRKPKDL